MRKTRPGSLDTCTHRRDSIEEDEGEDDEEVAVGEQRRVRGDDGHQDGHDGHQSGVQEAPGEPAQKPELTTTRREKAGSDPLDLPEGRVTETHDGHGVFEAVLLLSDHVDDEEGDEGGEGQHQVDGDEGVGEFLHLHRTWLTHHDHLQVHLAPHGPLGLHLDTNQVSTNGPLSHGWL